MRLLYTLVGAAFVLTLNPFQSFANSRVETSQTYKNYTIIGENPAQLRSQVELAGGQIAGKLRYHSGWQITLTHDAISRLRSQISILSEDENDESPPFLEEDRVVHTADLSIDPVPDSPRSEPADSPVIPWGVQAIHAPEAYPVSRGTGVVVCVADTGVQKDHPDLEANIIGGENTVRGQDSERWTDDNGHGTHVAGTIAALDNDFGVTGVAPEAKIFAVKALNARGMGTDSSLAEGIRSCMAHQARVINLSVGYSDDSTLVRRAIQDALKKGIVVVAAAGNEKSGVLFPAKYPGVIAVSALDQDMKLASFSNTGPEVAFGAPGTNILSTSLKGRYARLQGTSMAAPHVAGVAALMIAGGASSLQGEDVGLSRNEQGAGCISATKTLLPDFRLRLGSL